MGCRRRRLRVRGLGRATARFIKIKIRPIDPLGVPVVECGDVHDGADVASGIRIQYGGSVKPDNAGELFGQEDIDGGLIGGASLDSRSFVEIVRAAL